MSRQTDLLPHGLKARFIAPRIPALIEDQILEFIVLFAGQLKECQRLVPVTEPGWI